MKLGYTMTLYRSWAAVAVWSVCFLPLFGQVVEEENLETSKSTVSRPSVSSQDLAPIGKLIVSKTNDFRKSQQLDEVASNAELTSAAEYFANYMAQTNRYSHTADGKRPADRAKEHGYEYCMISENIAYQFSSVGFKDEELAEKFVEGWKNSPGHRKNMLEPFVLETGVAVAQSDKTGYYYAVQMFGRPRSKSIEFSLQNETAQIVEYTIAQESFTLPPMYSRTHMRCKPPEVRVKLGENKPAQTLKPTSGHSYLITLQNGELSVREQ